MPTSLPDHTTSRCKPAGVTRRTLLRFFVPLAPAAAAASTTFTALGDTDVVQRWLRCCFAGPPRIPA